ncbi:DUF1871 family protein [Macrococcus capreoli]|uniref:DUF1871 family protein n=1 Tax=Macrococcus capreoli TaxID=2982690 RepID=UPI0021D609C2|nr:DUF1871 family protein [Macrococcus sp. TMW 2.2395]MCU7556393.1 DUF1871 family protein [Macrococcus sp. TMW 2.2395]
MSAMNPDFNIAMYKILNDWNPMQLEDATQGDMEYYEIMDLVHQKLPFEETVSRISEVFLHSFEQSPQKEEITDILNKIYQLKATCEIV